MLGCSFSCPRSPGPTHDALSGGLTGSGLEKWVERTWGSGGAGRWHVLVWASAFCVACGSEFMDQGNSQSPGSGGSKDASFMSADGPDSVSSTDAPTGPGADGASPESNAARGDGSDAGACTQDIS